MAGVLLLTVRACHRFAPCAVSCSVSLRSPRSSSLLSGLGGPSLFTSLWVCRSVSCRDLGSVVPHQTGRASSHDPLRVPEALPTHPHNAKALSAFKILPKTPLCHEAFKTLDAGCAATTASHTDQNCLIGSLGCPIRLSVPIC